MTDKVIENNQVAVMGEIVRCGYDHEAGAGAERRCGKVRRQGECFGG